MKSVFCVIIAVAISRQSTAESFVTNDSFVVRFPPGWEETSREALDLLEAAIGDASKGTVTHRYDYGYQLASAEDLFEYPYVLMQVNRDGRIPEGQLIELERIEKELDEGIEIAADSLSAIISHSSQESPLYDERQHILWSTLSADYQGVGRIRALVAVKLTEYGFIQIMAYATDDTFGQYSPIFREVVDNLVLAKQHQYQPSITDHAPIVWGLNLGRVAISAAVASCLAGAFFLIRHLRRSRKMNSTREAVE
jgi:hypothetical protein